MYEIKRTRKGVTTSLGILRMNWTRAQALLHERSFREKHGKCYLKKAIATTQKPAFKGSIVMLSNSVKTRTEQRQRQNVHLIAGHTYVKIVAASGDTRSRLRAIEKDGHGAVSLAEFGTVCSALDCVKILRILLSEQHISNLWFTCAPPDRRTFVARVESIIVELNAISKEACLDQTSRLPKARRIEIALEIKENQSHER